MTQCYVNIGHINRKGYIRKESENFVLVSFYKCPQWNNHKFRKDQVKPIVSAENQRKIRFN